MRTGVAVVVVAAIALVAYLAASPYIAMHHIKVAIEQRNGAALADFVDFSAVRQSVKDQFKAQAFEEAVAGTDSDAETGLAAVGAAIAGVVVDGMVDAVVTPTGLNKLMENSKVKGVIGAPLKDAKGSYEGFDRFVIITADDPEKQMRFVLRRQGLAGWKLTDIVLPLGLLKQNDEFTAAEAADQGPTVGVQGIGDLLPSLSGSAPAMTPTTPTPDSVADGAGSTGPFHPLMDPKGIVTQGRCHMGVCEWVKWLSGRAITPPGHVLVSTSIVRGTSEHEEAEDYPTTPDGVNISWAPMTTIMTTCSYMAPKVEMGQVISMSPQTGVFGFQESEALMYFMACHSDPSTGGLDVSIKKYGYNVEAR